MGITPKKGVAFNISGVEVIKTVEGNKKNFNRRDVTQVEGCVYTQEQGFGVYIYPL